MSIGTFFSVGTLYLSLFFIYWQIAPAEVEGLLLSHPEILDAAVIP
jgi:hypothetical protein